MSTFVLVHGAWHGSWCWQRVTPLLRALGHSVTTPCLTGLGERAHLLTSDTDLQTHIADISNHLIYEDLQDVILVAHSYSGIVATGVLELVPERVRRLVFLDAFVPFDGECEFDLLPVERRAMIEGSAQTVGDQVILPPMPVAHWGLEPGPDADWVASKLTPHPLKSMRQPVSLRHPMNMDVPRTYLYCGNKPKGNAFNLSATRAKEAGWDFHVLATGHDVMVIAPDMLVERLLALP